MRTASCFLVLFVGMCCLANPVHSAKQPTANVHQVIMTNDGGTNKFDPPTINIMVGEQVKWVNQGGTHTATSDDIKTGDLKYTFNTGTVKKGQDTTIIFNKAGTYKYHCEYHNDMTGTVVVQ